MVDRRDQAGPPRDAAGGWTPEAEAAAERFDRYLDTLLAGGRPSPGDVGDRDEADMARLAAELAAASAPGEPDPAFVEQLRRRMREADAGVAAVREPPPVRSSAGGIGRVRLTRRDLLHAGLGAAAGLAAGAMGMAAVRREAEDWEPPSDGDDAPLVGGEGFWAEVARLDELPPGTARRFQTAAFDGFVVNDGGTVRALSAVCTHMACTLHFRPDWQDLRCPCHGASFDLAGRLANGRSTWRTAGAYPGDASAYPIDLPNLARPRVKVEDGSILVWTAQV